MARKKRNTNVQTNQSEVEAQNSASCSESNDIKSKTNGLFRKKLSKAKKESAEEPKHDDDSLNDYTSPYEGSDTEYDKVIEDVDKTVLLRYISPEIRANERLKRKHKDTLLKFLKNYMWMQGILLVLVILLMVISEVVFHAIGNDFTPEMVDIFFKFFLAYISSFVVEIIGLLYIVVKNVFDTTITELSKEYRDKDYNNDKEKEPVHHVEEENTLEEKTG